MDLVDIFEDTTKSTDNFLEIDRFKAKFQQIWLIMLEATYEKYDNSDMSLEEYLKTNELHFADDPEPENELDDIMSMLDNLMDDEDLEDITSEAKAPTYNGEQLKSKNEQRKTEATNYEYKHANSKTPNDSRSRSKSGSYEGTPSGQISKRKDAKVIRNFSPMAEKLQDELRELIDRQRIGKRRQLFRA